MGNEVIFWFFLGAVVVVAGKVVHLLHCLWGDWRKHRERKAQMRKENRSVLKRVSQAEREISAKIQREHKERVRPEQRRFYDKQVALSHTYGMGVKEFIAMSKCPVEVHGGDTICDCWLAWDTGEPEPPHCRSWPEDRVDEDNGWYRNQCTQCKFPFMGHKRRLRCKRCG